MVDAIKEEIAIRPKWSLGQYLTSGPAYTIQFPAQVTRSNVKGYDDTTIVDDLIITAAKEKAKEKFVFKNGDKIFDDLIQPQLGSRKLFTISFSEMKDYIIPKELETASETCTKMLFDISKSNLSVLPNKGQNRTVDRLRSELEALDAKQITRNNIEIRQKKLELLVQNSKLRPDIMKNILRDDKLINRDVKKDPQYRTANDALVKASIAKKNNEDYITHLITAYQSLQQLLKDHPDDFKDVGLVAIYKKRNAQIDNSDSFTINV